MDHQPWTPGRILQTSGAYWAACALHAAVALDLFARIGDDRVDDRWLADQLDAPADGLGRLLDALCALGLVTKEDGGYANTPAARAFLCPDSEQYIGYIIRHHHHLVASWARLPEALVSGEPVRLPVRERNEDAREAFLMGMFNLANQLAPRLVPAVDLSGRTHLLDLGGGPGTYALHFCRRYPKLAATVMDLETTRPFAEKTIAARGMQDRVAFVSGNYLEDALPGGFDVVWMSHILHGESPDDCQRIIHRAARALNPGGLALIHEFILNDDKTGPLFPALFSLNMLLGTEAGRSYSQSELFGMLAKAGFKGCRRLDFIGPNESGILSGTKPVEEG